MALVSQHTDFLSLLVLTANRQPVMVLLPGGQAAADMTFGLVYIQDDAGLGGQCRVDVLKTVRHVLVHCGL